MSRGVSIIAVLLLLPLTVWGQHAGRHGANTGTSGVPTTPPEDPDMATFKHAIAVQANEQQVEQFRIMKHTTESARRQANDLQRLGAGSEKLFSKADSLQDAVEQAQSDYRTFRRSLSDSQEAGLKSFTRKLSKSNATLTKHTKVISQLLDERTLDSGRLLRAAATLEKVLAMFQSEQLSLGKEMGINSI